MGSEKERPQWACEEWLIIYTDGGGGWGGGGKDLGRCPKGLSYAKEDPWDTEGLAIVKVGLFFSGAKH